MRDSIEGKVEMHWSFCDKSPLNHRDQLLMLTLLIMFTDSDLFAATRGKLFQEILNGKQIILYFTNLLFKYRIL